MVALNDISSHSKMEAEDIVSNNEHAYKSSSEERYANGNLAKTEAHSLTGNKTINCETPVRHSSSNCQNTSLEDMKQRRHRNHEVEECSLIVAFLTFLSFGVLLFVGYVKEFFYPSSCQEKNREGYVPLYIGFESFYTRNVYRRIQHCWSTPIASVPGNEIEILERYSPDHGWTMKLSGKKLKCLNVGSYNYLGFAENTGKCHDDAVDTTKNIGSTTSSPRLELGSLRIHHELETLMAQFLKVDDAIVFGMGFATNVLNIPALFGPGCLVLSDEFNHASIILGMKVSGATVKVFRHNDIDDLERLMRLHIVHGHPRTRRAWRKVLVVVEGIYSMEGTICNLPELIQLKKKYKAYLYVDEAHSIGALGPNGGGVVDYYGANARDVDIHMGTFTKSFGSAGGYIAGSKDLINFLRVNSDAQSYAASMPAPVAQQILSSLSIIMGRDGTDEGGSRIRQLARNVRYFRQRLIQLGFIVYGHDHSPVVPLLVFMIPKLSVFVEQLKKRGVASVAVGFPATKLNGARMRFCLSASHTKDNLDYILAAVDEVGDLVACKHSSRSLNHQQIEW